MFYSHSKKLLIDHLKEVQRYAKGYHHQLDELDRNLVDIVTLTHDFGKFTTFFQNRLLGKERIRDDRGNHSYISALFGSYVAWKSGASDEAIFLVFSTILSHHSRVKNTYDYLPKDPKDFKKAFAKGLPDDGGEMKSRLEKVVDQIEDLKNNKDVIKADMELLSSGSNINYTEIFNLFLSEWSEMIDLICLLKKTYRMVNKGKNPELYFVHQQLFSLLTVSDKLSASKTQPFLPGYLSFEKLLEGKQKYLETSDSSKINQIRNEIFENVQRAVEGLCDQDGLLTITAPTGTGKTLTGFFAAQRLKKKFENLEKIVYVLPFTSIIDQNYEVIKSILEKSGIDEKENLPYLMKHHHLTVLKNDTAHNNEEKNEMYTSDQFQMLLENWESGIVVTTFVQFLETLVSADNRMLKKFHAFQNTVFLLDEIQAVDIKFYSLMNYLFMRITEKLNCKIILMTATKPLFFPKARELLIEHESYFEQFNRTKLKINLSKTSVEEFCDQFVKYFEQKHPKPSIMIVVNTIQESLDIYEQLKDQLFTIAEITYLSANLIPKHRKERIEEVNRKLIEYKENEKEQSPRPIILVTTQIVEAGVDFDFDAVYRDLAPFDSIIQCAGRCNRHSNKKIGEVRVMQLVDEKGMPFGTKIYGGTILGITKKILEKADTIEEKDYLEFINAYFEGVKENSNTDYSKNYIKSIESMCFDPEEPNDIGHFKLIEEQYGSGDIFVVIDSNAETLLEEYKNQVNSVEKFEMASLAETKKKMREYTLSLPLKFLKYMEEKNITYGKSLWILPRDGLSMYDEATGFDRNLENKSFEIL